MGIQFKDLRFSITWNLFLLTSGAIVYILGMNAIVIHHNFIPGGLYGLCLFIFYRTDLLSPGLLYLLFNIPLLILSWIYISRRFMLYTIYTVVVIYLASEFITVDFGITNQLYAAIAGGFICGAGTGIILRSIGSAGGLDILAVILLRHFNIGVGKTYMGFNIFLFSMVLAQYSADIFIASIILTFVTANAVNYVLTLANQRKIAYVISDHSQKIAQEVTERLHLGATLIQAKGAYSGRNKEIMMTITNNLQLKRLEEAVFTIDEDALFIVENSFDVIGSSFRKRKIY